MNDIEKQLEKLREDFDPSVIGKKPIAVAKDGNKTRCSTCHQYLAPHQHIDFLGHAAVTDRLNSVDPHWTWEPMGYTPEGLPAVRVNNNMASLWIKLTVCGKTIPEVGTCAANKPEVEKELVSDAIGRAAMRFGVGLGLWSKTQLESAMEHPETGPEPAPSPAPAKKAPAAPKAAPKQEAPTQGGSMADDLMKLLPNLKSEAARKFSSWRREHGIPAAPASMDENQLGESYACVLDLLAEQEAAAA